MIKDVRNNGLQSGMLGKCSIYIEEGNASILESMRVTQHSQTVQHNRTMTMAVNDITTYEVINQDL